MIRRPIITEKGLGVKETQHTVVFEVATDATKTEIKEAVQRIFKVKVAACAPRFITESFAGGDARKVSGSDWKKAYVKLAPGEKMIEYAENL